MKTKPGSTSILDLIQTYIGLADQDNSKKAALIYLEFLEAGIIEVYTAHQNILQDKYSESEVFDRDQKVLIINKVQELQEDFSDRKNRATLFQAGRRVLAQLYLPNQY